MKKFFAAFGLSFLLTVVAFSQAPTQESKSSQSDAQILREILAELKQLRSVMAKTSVNQARFQAAFEQYKTQQSLVTSLGREMDSIKSQLPTFATFRATNDDYIKAAEERLNQVTDPRQRQTIERQIQTSKRNIEMQDQREKRMKERQTALEMQIPMEQGKLDQLNAEIERIKQEMNALLLE